MNKKYKYKEDTIFNFVPQYQALIDIDTPAFVKLPKGEHDPRLKDVERDLQQYWQLIHPMIREYIITVVNYLNDLGGSSQNVENIRRQLNIEIENSAQLSQENRELKEQLSELMIEKQGLEERINDLQTNRPTIAPEKYEALKLLTSSKFDTHADLEEALTKAVQEAKESNEIKRLHEEHSKMERELQDAKKRFEKTQAEVAEDFQKKILAKQERINELEAELAKVKGN